MICTKCKVGHPNYTIQDTQEETIEIGSFRYTGRVTGYRCSRCNAFYVCGPSLGLLEAKAFQALYKTGNYSLLDAAEMKRLGIIK